MADKAHRLTDEKLEEMEKRLSAIYSRAEKEIQKTADEYFSKFAKQDEAKRKLLEQGKITEDEYKKWRKGKVMYGKRFTEMKEQYAKQLLNVNQTALAYVNGELPEVYAINYNALAGAVDGVGGYSFTLVDADTVRNLAVTDTSLLPYKEIDPKKDIPWNMKKINAETLQGILQGESMDKIAKRLRNVQEMNKTQAIRSARTIVTGAENKGRQDSYARAEADGIILQKEWIATNDSRVRHSHAMLDGAIVDQDKKFDNGLMYPGDPSGRPEEVYNCRCTLVAKVNGFKKVQVQKAMAEKRVEEPQNEWSNSLEPRGQLPHINEDDLYSYVATEIKVDEQRAIEYTDAVMGFTDNSGLFTDVRKYQRGEKLDEWADMDAVKAISRDAEEYIKVAPRWNGGETYRGVTLSDKELSSYTVGSTLDMGGMSSWSSKKSVASDFANRNATYERPNSVMFHCDTQSKGTGIRHMSVIELEDEVLCSKDAKYQVLKVETQDDGITHIFLKEVEQ